MEPKKTRGWILLLQIAFFLSLIVAAIYTLIYDWPFPGVSHQEWAEGCVAVAAGSALTLLAVRKSGKAAKESRANLERLEKTLEDTDPNKKPEIIWRIASETLKTYFNRNLEQVFLIFVVAIVTMLVGFVFLLWGLKTASANPYDLKSWIGTIPGTITEFIGATFLVIYRSTMAQANSFIHVLERINNVGMAVQILESIPEGESDLKNKTRAELIRLLFENAAGHKVAGK